MGKPPDSRNDQILVRFNKIKAIQTVQEDQLADKQLHVSGREELILKHNLWRAKKIILANLLHNQLPIIKPKRYKQIQAY